MNEQEFRQLLREGEAILNAKNQQILKALNMISEKYIHKENDSYRRSSDMMEICMALALAERVDNDKT